MAEAVQVLPREDDVGEYVTPDQDLDFEREGEEWRKGCEFDESFVIYPIFFAKEKGATRGWVLLCCD